LFFELLFCSLFLVCKKILVFDLTRKTFSLYLYKCLVPFWIYLYILDLFSNLSFRYYPVFNDLFESLTRSLKTKQNSLFNTTLSP
jgi:hypothetical protein